jgi:1,4-alpha-glucan branching enzyme
MSATLQYLRPAKGNRSAPKAGPVELAFFSPHNDEIALISSWNGWKRQPMRKDADGWWRITSDLRDGDQSDSIRSVRPSSRVALADLGQ